MKLVFTHASSTSVNKPVHCESNAKLLLKDPDWDGLFLRYGIGHLQFYSHIRVRRVGSKTTVSLSVTERAPPYDMPHGKYGLICSASCPVFCCPLRLHKSNA